MKPTPANDDTYLWGLLRLSMAIKKRFIEPADDFGLTALQAITLGLLQPDQPCSMGAVAQIASCDPSNLSDTIERLVQAGLLVRQDAPGDRRRKLLSLTDKGLRIRSQLYASASRLPFLNETSLSNEEAEQLHSLLRKALAA